MTAIAIHRQAAEALTARIIHALSLEEDDPQKDKGENQMFIERDMLTTPSDLQGNRIEQVGSNEL